MPAQEVAVPRKLLKRFGVPTADHFEHLAAIIAEATPLLRTLLNCSGVKFSISRNAPCYLCTPGNLGDVYVGVVGRVRCEFLRHRLDAFFQEAQ